MQITHVNGQALADLDLEAFIERAEGPAYSSEVELRQRSRLYPVVEDVTLNESERTLYVAPVDGAITSQDDQEAFNLLVRRIFAPSLRAALVTGTWHGETYQNLVWFRGDARPQPSYWEVTVLAANPTWESTTLSADSDALVSVLGNAYAQPTITITGGAACTRYAVVVTDNSGHGIGSYMISVAVAGAADSSQVICFHNGLSVPFALVSNRVYLRVGARLGRPAVVDIYVGAGVSNDTATADGLDAGGLTLDAAIASGVFEPAIEDPFEHPLSAALCWHPGIVTKHDNSRAYTFGWDGARIRLVDRESTGAKVLLDDDMDAVVLTSPVGLDSISGLSLTLRAGYRPGRVVSTADDAGAEKVMRVILSTIDGSAMAAGPKLPEASGNVRDLIAGTLQDFPVSRNAYLFYAQFTFGDVTFPNTYSYDSRDDPASATVGAGLFSPDYNPTGLVRGIFWRNDYLPWDLPALAASYIGCTVELGAEGVYYLRFPAGAFRGMEELPLLSMRLVEKGATFEIENNDPDQDNLTVIISGDTSLNDVLLFDAEWVDPVTLEPFDSDDSDAITDDPLIGKARVSIWSRARNAEDWTRRWTSSLSGSDSGGAIMQDGKLGVSAVLAPGAIDLGGDTQVAIGLEPLAADPNQVEWAELEIGGTPEITTVAAERPSLAVETVAAQRLHGGLANDTLGERLDLVHVYADATGLEINTSQVGTERAVRGAGGVGPVYGLPQPSAGTRLFDLVPAEDNVISKSGNLSGATVSFSWRDRVAW